MTNEGKKSEKKIAVQTAMTAGFHLDTAEALALIKSGFFKEEPIEKNTPAPIQTPQAKKS